MRSDRPRLHDILDAIASMRRYTPATREQFDAAAEPIKSHILLQVQIIGEAASRLSQRLRDQNPHVPWRSIMRMRNVIAHVYFGIDWNEVWQVVVSDAPTLETHIQAILASFPQEDEDAAS